MVAHDWSNVAECVNSYLAGSDTSR